MKNLLNKQERRRLTFVQLLSYKKDWVLLADLATQLGCSTRVLKYDIQFYKENSENFTIHSSNHGIRLEYFPNRGLKAVCQKILAESDNYRLLETVFLNQDIPVQELAHKLDTSLSTLYRMIDQLNRSLKKDYGFQIETGPCRLVGSEKRIRSFFYGYFYEKYDHFGWPFKQTDEASVDVILKKVIQAKKLPTHFIHFTGMKVIVLVNFIRYRDQAYIDIEADASHIQRLMTHSSEDQTFYDFMENTFHLTFDEELLIQIMPQFVQKGFYYTYEDFILATKNDAILFEQATFLRNALMKIALKNDLKCPNAEMVIYALFNMAFLEDKMPQSNFILYDHNGDFARAIQDEFPSFHQDLWNEMKQFRVKMEQPLTEKGINFYIYTVFSWWQDLIPALRRKSDKIKVLVVSDGNKMHAEMLKDFIDFEFNEQLAIDISDELTFEPTCLKANAYELIITSFMTKDFEGLRNIYISNLPKASDYIRIQQHIEEITFERRYSK